MPVSEQDVVKLNTALENISNQLKEHGVKAEQSGRLSTEVKNAVDSLLTQQAETQARLQAAEQLVAKLENGSQARDKKPETIGAQVIASDEFKAFQNHRGKGQFSVGIKNVLTSTDIIAPQRVPGLVMPGQQRLTVRDLLAPGRTVSNSVEFVREASYTNSADVVSENPSAAKPESAITFELDSASVTTIAHYLKASKQVLADEAMMMSYIDARLTYGLKLKEEAQLLNGSGVGVNIDGLVTQATAYANPGVDVQIETQVDRLRLALLQAELADYFADGIVLNPIDWTAIELTKDTTNQYVFARPQGIAGPALWGRPVVATKSMTAGDYLVGAFAMAAQLWDREDSSVTVSNSNEDDFIKNLVTILCEERLTLTVYRPDAFITGDFDGLPSS